MTATVPQAAAESVTADPQTLAVILRSAADAVAAGDALWRGESYDSETSNRTCVVNAIGAAVGRMYRQHPRRPAARDAVKDAAFAALATHLGLDTELAISNLIEWNDHTEHENPQQMVEGALHAAADRVLARPPSGLSVADFMNQVRADHAAGRMVRDEAVRRIRNYCQVPADTAERMLDRTGGAS